jgi:Fibronectin type III domain
MRKGFSVGASEATKRLLDRLRVGVLILCGMLLVACAHEAVAPNADRGDGVVTLKWQPPTLNENGEPLTDLVAYHVLYGRTEDDLRYSVRINDPSQSSVIVNGLGSGKWYFSIVAVNEQGKASKPSNVVSKVIP